MPCHRSEEHTSELQSLSRISYAVFCFDCVFNFCNIVNEYVKLGNKRFTILKEKPVSYTHLDVYKRQLLDCVNGKYLWALPTPTTFKKGDQTFICLLYTSVLQQQLLPHLWDLSVRFLWAKRIQSVRLLMYTEWKMCIRDSNNTTAYYSVRWQHQ